MKKILVFEQDNCGWCVRLHPHIKKLAKDFEVELEFVNITNKWEIADKYQFRSTPTVIVWDIPGDIGLRKFTLDVDRGIPGMVADIREFIK